MNDRKLSRRTFIRNTSLVAVGTVAGGLVGNRAVAGGDVEPVDTSSILNYSPKMGYRRLGKTGLWVSAVCMGGHWKRIDKMVPGVFKSKSWLTADLDSPGFRKNRRDVVTRCIESGINHIDACTWQECVAYAEALRGRRDAMFLGFSWYQEEMRNGNFRTTKALLGTLDMVCARLNSTM